MNHLWTLAVLTALVVCLPLQNQLSAHPLVRTQLADKPWNQEVKKMIERRLDREALPFEKSVDRYVWRHLRDYLSAGRRETKRILERAQFYFPIFEHYLQRYGLPAEFKYLPMVESRLLPDAESSAGAAGLWQFMPATGEAYGLTINEQLDERLDPQRSSEAAARFLSDLYAEFGDWTLVLAAYNCGSGRVARAIDQAGSSRYTDIAPYLPRQTRRYVSMLIAAFYVGEYGHFHGVTGGEI